MVLKDSCLIVCPVFPTDEGDRGDAGYDMRVGNLWMRYSR